VSKAKVVFSVIGVFGILISLLLIVAIFSPADNWISEKNSTYAIITKIKENISTRTNDNGQEIQEITYYVDAEYVVDNMVYTAKFETSTYHNKNDKKMLYYNPKNPNEYVWEGLVFLHTTLGRIVTFFIVFIISCLFIYLALKLRIGLL